MAEQHEPWVLATTALIAVIVKIAKDTDCATSVGDYIKNALSVLDAPFANGPSQVVLEKILTRLEQPNETVSLH